MNKCNKISIGALILITLTGCQSTALFETSAEDKQLIKKAKLFKRFNEKCHAEGLQARARSIEDDIMGLGSVDYPKATNLYHMANDSCKSLIR